MKPLLIIIGLLIGIVIHSNAQKSRDLSAGLGILPSGSGGLVVLYGNRHLNEKWQAGVMPMFQYSKGNLTSSTSEEYIMFALNLNTRYYIIDSKRWIIYGFGFGGYMKTYHNYFDSDGITDREVLNFIDIAGGGGTQLNLGQKGWSIDLTLGFIWMDHINGANDRWQGLLTFGVFKRFERPAN